MSVFMQRRDDRTRPWLVPVLASCHQLGQHTLDACKIGHLGAHALQPRAGNLPDGMPAAALLEPQQLTHLFQAEAELL